MNLITQGCKAVIFFGLFCCLKAADSRLRIVFDDGSATQGLLEFLHNDVWGGVCDDKFEIEEAKTACLQLGYDDATAVLNPSITGPSTFILDEIKCYPNHARLQDCLHDPFTVHDCDSEEHTAVSCTGGVRQTVASLHVAAAFYWNCDDFDTGTPYDIKNGHSAVVHGTATFTRSPIDSGFNLRGKSAWVNLGNFSDQYCLVNPQLCSLYVSSWLKIGKTSGHKTFILGNRYGNTQFYGFNIRIEGHRLRGDIRGSTKFCSFWEYHITVGVWFHIAMAWSNGGNNFAAYSNGDTFHKRKCWNDKKNYNSNSIYTLGADESLAGNTNRDLDVSYDDVVILYRHPSHHERKSPNNVATDFDTYAITNVTLKVPGLSWDSSYTDTSSSQYTQLMTELTELLRNDIYEEADIGLHSFHLETLQDNSGDLQMKLVLNFTKVGYKNGFRLFRSFNESKFFNTTPELLACESVHQSCDEIIIDNAVPNNNPEYADVYFHPIAEHLEDPYYSGYNVIAFKVDGSKTDVWVDHARPTSTALFRGHVKCGPYKDVSVTVQLRTIKGAGFFCPGFRHVRLPEGKPSGHPSYVRVQTVGAFNVTVIWGEIEWGQNGIIQRYKIQINNEHNHYLSSTHRSVNDTREVTFSILHPGKRYLVYVCGYTSYHVCGTWQKTDWFYATALLPGKAPRSVSVQPSPRKALLSWSVVHPDYQYGNQISYYVTAKNLRTEELDVNYHFPVSDQSKIQYSEWIYNLKGLTEYKLNISLINQVGQGPITNEMFSTPEGVPIVYPENFVAVNISSSRISMSWEAIDIEDSNGILQGYHIYYREALLNGSWNNVSATNLTGDIPVLGLRSYEIKICGYTRVGDGVISPITVVNSTGHAPTNLTRDIRVTNATNDTLTVEWTYQTELSRPAQYFIISATRNDTNITATSVRLDVMYWPENVYWITLNGLQEYKLYLIRVTAGNAMGRGPESEILVLNRTLEGVPSASPRNLTASNSSSRSILLQWKPVLYEYADGIILGHKVFWRLAGFGSDPWQEVYVNGTNNRSAEIENLEKYTDYEFKILAFNSIAESITTDTVIARTDEDIPLHPPLNVQTFNTSSRSLRVTWEPVPVLWRFGIIRGYQVIITDTRNGDEYIDDVKVGENRSLERAGFERYTNYTVKVAAYTIKGLGNFSEELRVITDEDVPSEAPSDIECNFINSTSLAIQWSVLPVVKAHGIVRTYWIFLERTDGRHIELYNDTQLYNSLNTSFHDLDEYVEYSVQVLATTIKGAGPRSNPFTCLTDEDVPHASPPGLHGFNTSDTSIKIFWENVHIDDRNGIITGYTIFYNTTLRNGNIRNHDKRVGKVLETELNALLPFKYYDIRVAAWTSKGMGPKSNVTTILTEEESPKYAPSNVKAFNTSSTSIRLKWTPIPPANVGGIIRGYKIFWEEVNYLGTVILQNETRLDNSSYKFLDFTGLTKFQEYRFSILAFTKFDGVISPVVSTMSDEDIPTLPPTNCSGFNISKNDIQVFWNEVPRPDRNGIILGYNIYTTEIFNYFATMPQDYETPNKSAVINTTDATARSFIQHNLLPYTDYSFQMDAFTSKGNGPKCTAFIIRTEEEAPLYSPVNMTIHNTSSTSMKVTWQGLDQNIIRGVFLGYEIWFTAHPQFPSAYLRYGTEARRKRRAAFTLDKQLVNAGVSHESIEITDLAKYTNYTVQVVGFTKFLGAQSEILTVLTDEDIPSKSPQDLGGRNLSSTSIYIKWRPVEDGFVHGILLGYRIYYRLTKAPTMPPFNKTMQPDQLETFIDTLFMFTNYTFQITAFTSKGEGPLCEEVVICTDEDVASKSPFNFKVVNLYHMHEIPLSWNPVPEGYLNGILIGYRIKMRIISDAMLDVYGSEKHIDVDRETLSYVVRKLLNFATYTFQIVALTKYGEGVHSSVRVAKTCPCEKYLSTNWYMLPPYANRTGDQETGIFPWLLKHLVTECCGDCSQGHGWSEIMYNTDGYGMDGFKDKIADFASILNDDTDFSFPVQGHSLQEKYATFYSYVYALASPGVAFFIVDDPPDKMPNAILDTVNGSWGMMLFAVIFSSVSGIVMWMLDAGKNEMEFPRRFLPGSGEGFWWAFISMTTVGYGDRSPRSFLARLFAIFWILAGLVLTSILMGNITNALTTVTFSTDNIMLYGTKVAAIDDSPSYRVGVRRCAQVNPDRSYYDAYELQKDLRERKVKGALLDGYMAGSYNELFMEKTIRVKEIIDYNTGYGIVLGGIHHRLQRCFKRYVKRKRSYIVDYIASQIQVVRKNPVSPAEAQSTNLFNPEADIFVKSMTFTLALFVAGILAGVGLHFYFKKRFRKKIRDSNEVTYKSIPKHTSEILESFCTRISSIKEELYLKHTNELRAMAGLKKRKVEYDILKQVKEELENAEGKDMPSSCTDITNDSKFSSQSVLIKSANTTRAAGSGESDVTSFDNVFTFENFESESPRLSIQDSFDESVNSSKRLSSPAKQSHIELDLASTEEHAQAEAKPDIKDLQREAYLAGMKAEGKVESGHPFAKMYRYLWVEK